MIHQYKKKENSTQTLILYPDQIWSYSDFMEGFDSALAPDLESSSYEVFEFRVSRA
jgi:hypothetical protein